MGSKPSINFQMDRPESGGADRKQTQEASGMLDRARQEFAASQQAKRDGSVRESERHAAPQGDGSPNETPGAPAKAKRPRASGKGKKGRR